jgi:hypothetical protein
MSARGDRLARRHRLAAACRLASSAAFLVLALAFFREPLLRVLGPSLAPAARSVGLGGLLGTAPAPGFLVQVTSHPAGAEVLVDGTVRGTTPAFLNVRCREGEEVALAVRRPGYREYRRVVRCREGQTLRARIRLER